MTGSSFLLLLRLGVSLAIVMGLIWVAARVLKARGGAMQFRQSGALLEVVERRPLGRNSSVALVRVGGHALLVGVAEQRVELLQAVPHLDLHPELETEQDDVVVTTLELVDDDAGDMDGIVVGFPAEPTTAPETATAARTPTRVPARQAAPTTRWTGSFGAPSSIPARTNLLDALRDVTVRRANAPRPGE